MSYLAVFLLLASAVPVGAWWGRSPHKAAIAGTGTTLALAILLATAVPPASAAALAILLSIGAAIAWAIPAAILAQTARHAGSTLWYSAWAIASYAGLLVGLLVLNAMKKGPLPSR